MQVVAKTELGLLYVYRLNKIDFATKIVTRDQGHFIMMTRWLHQEDVTIMDIYIHNSWVPKYSKQNLTELKGKMNSVTIVGGFNTSFSIMDRKTRPIQQGSRRREQPYEPTWPNRHLENTTTVTLRVSRKRSNSRRIHIFLKCAGNIL